MLKFFRRIRKELLSNNRIGKYLLYAMGEIILVVIGILIALNVNNRSEQRKTEARVESIFEDIMEELTSDIDKTTNLMRYFSRRDSMIYLVQNDLITKEDYQNPEIPSHLLWNLTGWYSAVDLTKDAYNNLTQDLNAVPTKYNDVLKDLNHLYGSLFKTVARHDQGMLELLDRNSQIEMRNHSWYAGNSVEDRNKKIDYMLNDFRYKNEVESYRNKGINNQLRWAIIYRQKAVACYTKIAELLDKPLTHESFTIDPEIADLLAGQWQVKDRPELVFRVFEEDNRLYMGNSDDKHWELYYLNRGKMVDSETNYATIVMEDNELFLKFNAVSLMKINQTK
jgi:hypothetical protein